MPALSLRHRFTSFLSLSLPTPTTPHHVAVYLVFLVLSSISLLVFLNSTISFVVTDILEIRQGKHHKNVLGNIVGTLGLVDEVVIIFAAPMWGILSDRWAKGGRNGVTALGFSIAALGLVGLSRADIVRGRNGVGKGIQLEGWEWWWWLVVFRAIFAVGAGAISTMISAVLPDLTSPPPPTEGHFSSPISTVLSPPVAPHPGTHSNSEAAPSSPAVEEEQVDSTSSPKLAGIVGLFSGLGALVALTIFLPLPTLLDPTKRQTLDGNPGSSPVSTGTGEGLKRAYWIVAGYAIVCGAICWLGLPHYPTSVSADRNSHGATRHSIVTASFEYLKNKFFSSATPSSSTEEERLIQPDHQSEDANARNEPPNGFGMFALALKAGRTRWRTIGISYVGGFIARAASVGLSLFIPLFVNHYFITQGLCNPTSPDDKEAMKRECRRAYVLAAELTGTSQFVALLCAPIVGYISSSGGTAAPLRVLSITSFLGTIGFIGFGLLESPELSVSSLLFSALLGIGQIGAVVGSLGLLGQGQHDAQSAFLESPDGSLSSGHAVASSSEVNPNDLKGSIAGVYSLAGGMGILFLTKGGGMLFDRWSSGAPFHILGVFMGLMGLLAGWEGWARASP